MSVTYGFYNSVNHDRKYNALDMSRLFDGIIRDGILMSVGNTLVITASGGMTVMVDTGRAWFNSTWTNNDAKYPLGIEQSDIALDRVDAVVLEVNTDDASRFNQFKVLRGLPSDNPQRPTLMKDGPTYQYALAYIYVAAAAEEITTSDITNVIGTSECPFVSGILETANVDYLYSHWEEQFNEWFDHLEDELTTNQAANLQLQVDQRVKISDKATLAEAEAGIDNTKWMTPFLATSVNSNEIGDIKWTGYPLTDPKYLPCDGRILDKAEYPILYSKLPTAVSGDWTKNKKWSTSYMALSCSCFSPELGIFVALGYTGYNTSNKSMYFTSSDGINWSAGSLLPDYGQVEGVCWSGAQSQFVAVATYQGNKGWVYTSPNGVTWTRRATDLGGGTGGTIMTGVTWSPELGIYVAFGKANVSRVVGCIWTSPDGAVWTFRRAFSPLYDSTPLGITWSKEKGIFVLVGTNTHSGTPAYYGVSLTSPDGINWTEYTDAVADYRFQNVCWSSKFNMFVACANGASTATSGGSVFTSPDGVAWTPVFTRVTEGSSIFCAIWWDPVSEVFALMGSEGAPRSAIFYTSIDGINWTFNEGIVEVNPVGNGDTNTPGMSLASGKGVIIGTAVEYVNYYSMFYSTSVGKFLPNYNAAQPYVSIKAK